MTEYTRESMPPVPAGKVRIWGFENGPLPTGLGADVTPVQTATAAVHSYPTATLAYETRGYVCAGSCMRWQEAHWSVLYWLPDGTRHGRRFHQESEAREYFTNLTDPQKVSARRQQDAMLEDTVYRPAREKAAAEAKARAEAEKARKAARRRQRRAA